MHCFSASEDGLFHCNLLTEHFQSSIFRTFDWLQQICCDISSSKALTANNVVHSPPSSVTGDCNLSQHALCERQGAFWTGRRPKAGLMKSRSPSNGQRKVSASLWVVKYHCINLLVEYFRVPVFALIDIHEVAKLKSWAVFYASWVLHVIYMFPPVFSVVHAVRILLCLFFANLKQFIPRTAIV